MLSVFSTWLDTFSIDAQLDVESASEKRVARFVWEFLASKFILFCPSLGLRSKWMDWLYALSVH